MKKGNIRDFDFGDKIPLEDIIDDLDRFKEDEDDGVFYIYDANGDKFDFYIPSYLETIKEKEDWINKQRLKGYIGVIYYGK